MKKSELIEKAISMGLQVEDSMTMNKIQELIDTKEAEFKEESMTPYEYFRSVKSRVRSMGKQEISRMYSAAEGLMDKYKIFGQEKAEKRLAFHIKTLLKEANLVDLGINKFVYKEDILRFIDNVSKKPVKIIEMKNYPREIPDEMIEVVQKTKDIFDDYFILFTDYSEGELQKEVEKERDPILFGGFCTRSRNIVADRFYYLGDWEDEYCDLTLDKLIEQTSKDIVKDIKIPENTDELIEQLSQYEEKDDGRLVLTSSKPRKKSFFKNIISVFTGDRNESK